MMNKHYNWPWKQIALTAAIAALTAPSFAQEFELEEITVTAQKRAEDIQDVPISITAVSGDFMEKNGLDTLDDLQNFVPNFSIGQSSQVTNQRIAIRGISSVGNTAIEPSVGVFIDGVYYPRPGSLVGNMVDIQSVEVLRGPQGTLFGRNTPAGALNITTRAPSQEAEVKLIAGAGSHHAQKLAGTISGGFTDTVSGRLTFNANDRDGYGENLLDGKRFGEREDTNVRGKLLIEPSDDLAITLSADHSEITHGGAVVELVSGTEKTAFSGAITQLFGSAPDTRDTFDGVVNQLHKDNAKDKNSGIGMDITWDIDGHTLRSITSHRQWDSEYLDETSLRLPADLVPRNTVYDTTTTSQEFQLISNNDGPFNYVAGAYLYRESYTIDSWFDAGTDLCLPTVYATVLQQFLRAGAPLAVAQTNAGGAAASCTAQAQSHAVDADFEQDLTGVATFAQATYRFNEQWSATGGLRWSEDDKTGSFEQKVNNSWMTALNFRVPEAAPDLAFKDSAVTWLANLSYYPTDAVMLFATASTGFKSGGFNSEGASVDLSDRRVFGSEKSTNVELGLKSQWLDGRAEVNATLYRTRLEDFQDRSFDGTSFITTNAGELQVQGLELDVRFRPVQQLMFVVGIGTLDSEFLSFPNASPLPGSNSPQDLKGRPNHRAPEWQTSLMASWTDAIGRTGWDWFAQASHHYVSEQNVGGNTNQNPQTLQPGYVLVNARAGVETQNGQWRIETFVDNAFNEGYCSTAFDQPLGANFGGVNPTDNTSVIRCNIGAPRTYGLQLTWMAL